MIRLSKSQAIKMGLAKGRSKYGAVPTMVDGIRFASKKEAARYGVLKALEREGKIERLSLQPVFPLMVTRFVGGEVKVGVYKADFQYWEYGKRKIEDCKGVRTPVYRLKKKIVEMTYGIKILET